MIMIKTKEKQTGQNSAADMAELARLSRLCIGSSSIKEFSERSNLSRAFLSAITNEKLRGVPTRRSLSKMTSSEAQPQNGITLEQLAKAAGLELEVQDTIPEKALDFGQERKNGFLDDIREYCAADTDIIKTAAPFLMMHLLQQGASVNLHLSEENGCIIYRDDGNTSSERTRTHVCIPAFVPDRHMALIAASAAILKLGEAKGRYKEDTNFYVLTDNSETYDYLTQVFRMDESTEVLQMAVSQPECDAVPV